MQHKTSSSPVPSCVSMKSDRSMDHPGNFRADVPAGQSPMQHKRPSSPVPSCVSMKSDWSMDLPLHFRADVPAGQSPMQHKRSSSPVPSCVSMKSDRSMVQPWNFRADVPAGQSPMQHKRSSSPVPSCMSMKSDRSMFEPGNFRGDVPAGQSPMQHKRPSSPVPSCVSMKSDRSMDHPWNFRADVPAGQSPMQHKRPSSPVPSCVSMKSDRSMDHPWNFRADVPAGQSPMQHKRSSSPVPSCISMKSDRSMIEPWNFRGDVPAGQSPMQHKRPSSPVPSCVSMKSDRSMVQPWNFRADVPAGQRFHSGLQSKEMEQAHKSHRLKKSQCLMEGLTHQGNPALNWYKMQQAHKSRLLWKSQSLMEGLTHQGIPTLLRKIYTDLYITQGGRGEVNEEHEVRQIERASWGEADQDSPVKCSDVFESLSKQVKPLSEPAKPSSNQVKPSSAHVKPSSKEVKPLGIVLTKGVAGVGKTVSVQKLLLDWAEGTSNQDVDFIFPLPFRELNLMKEKTISLVDLVKHFFSDVKDPRVFTSSEHRVMFIFDGLDECRLPLNFSSNPKCCDVTKSVPVDVLLTNLIQGNLLPSALLWITTRPAAAGLIPTKCVNQVTEIRGFNDTQKEEYFRKKLSDENLVSKIIAHLKSSRSLYIMCHIPVFSWISATVVENTSYESGRVEMPRTLTQMYTHFLIIQVTNKNTKYTEHEGRDEEMILKLGKLAFQQLEKGNLIFYDEDLRECGIDVTEASVYSGVCTQIFREEAGLYQAKVFSFVHLSIQEFLAALYVFLCFSNSKRNMSDQQLSSQLSALLRAATLQDLHKTAVDLALQSRNGHLDLFLRFLLGLSLESNQNLLRHLIPQNNSQSQSSETTVQLVKHNISNLRDLGGAADEDEDEDEDDRRIRDYSNRGSRYQSGSDRQINLFYCLNELNEHAVVEHIDRTSGTLSVEMLLPGQWETGEFRFETSEEYLEAFDLQTYVKTPEVDQTELLSPDDVLQKLMPSDVFISSTSAQLDRCPLSERSLSYLASALISHSSRLTQLTLGQASSSSLEVSSSAGCHPDCKPWEFR
ncbi:NACHT, LRR and PYD domains-containing protein 3-like [Engraulis encrasicolus]|uniref:NACHT, LRR and PYD domains-containing protein 3-like n=1 Tax=Engraulis encrasicolus TaxID=184585 RepID=UPI002FCF0748